MHNYRKSAQIFVNDWYLLLYETHTVHRLFFRKWEIGRCFQTNMSLWLINRLQKTNNISENTSFVFLLSTHSSRKTEMDARQNNLRKVIPIIVRWDAMIKQSELRMVWNRDYVFCKRGFHSWSALYWNILEQTKRALSINNYHNNCQLSWLNFLNFILVTFTFPLLAPSTQRPQAF